MSDRPRIDEYNAKVTVTLDLRGFIGYDREDAEERVRVYVQDHFFSDLEEPDEAFFDKIEIIPVKA